MGWWWHDIVDRYGTPALLVRNRPLAIYPYKGGFKLHTSLPLPEIGARKVTYRRAAVGEPGGWLLVAGTVQLPRKQLERSLEQLARSGHGVVEYSREGDNIELTLERDVELLTDEQAAAAADEGRLVATDTERWMGDSTLQAWIASRKILEHHPPPFVYCFPHGPIAQDHLAGTSRFETAHDLHRWSGDLFWREFPVCRPSASLADAIDPSTGMVVDEDPIQSWRVDRDGVLYRTTATVADSAVDSDLARFAVFSRAAVAHPELAELVPPKPRNAARCRTCKGAGWSARRGTEPRECDRCDGLGVAILRRY